MSRYNKSYGKNKSHGGAGLQFDQLIKVCSNSKKPAVAKTAGALGRFGVASFTSTRNSSFDSPEEERSKFSSLKKRPRLDSASLNMPASKDPFLFAHSPLETANPAKILKPRKFFKSRGPMEVEVDASTIKPVRPEISNLIAPLVISNPLSNSHSLSLKSHKSSLSNNSKSLKTLRNTTNVSPPTNNKKNKNNNNLDNNSTVNKPIKLRIFKDKATSKLVSVSDAPPPNLEEQEQPKSLPVPKTRGRKPKAKSPEKHHHHHHHNPPKPGRVTRNSKKQRNSDSSMDTPMPTLSRALPESENTSAEESENSSIFCSPHTVITTNTNSEFEVEPPIAVETLKKLEEDAEFQKLSEMLSSMEEGNDDDGVSSADCSFLLSPPCGLPPPPPPPPLRPKAQDIRSILEEDWDESESFEEELPRKANQSQSPPKVSRFDMSAFMPPGEDSPLGLQSQSQGNGTTNAASTTGISCSLETPPKTAGTLQSPFNASPYAVRNLLSSPDYENKAVELIELAQNLETFADKLEEEPNSKAMIVIPEKGEERKQSASQPIISKKRMFFKHRRQSTGSAAGGEKNKKRLALYKHNFGDEDNAENDEGQSLNKGSYQQGPNIFQDFEDDEDDDDDDDEDVEDDLQLRKLRIENSGSGYSASLIGGESNKVLCKKQAKKLFTVVKNTRPVHELQESAEVHEFDGDIFYILSDLKDNQPSTIRCLSAIGLATRCMEPAFRMHLRAHGTVGEFCKELHDAPQNPILALLAATVLFVLSQDRLNMDLDTESLKLILALTKTEEVPHRVEDTAEILKHRQRVIDLCSEMKNRGHAKHLKLDKITASELALETLLYLTSKRAGEWVKHELRTLGGLDYIVAEVDVSMVWLQMELAEYGWTEAVIERLWKVDRCLRVLQQVTFNHEDNQRYLLGVHQGKLEPDRIAQNPVVFNNLFRFCKETLEHLDRAVEPACVLREILFSVLRVLVNLTHDYRGIVIGSEIMMSLDGFVPLALHSVFHMTSIFPDEKVFDLLIHSLCMLLNVVEHSRKSRAMILASTIRKTGRNSTSFSDSQSSNDSGVEEEQSTLDALVEMFLIREQMAKKEETSTDDILTKGADSASSSQKDSQNTDKDKNSQDTEGSSVQDTIDKLIQTAGKHMENSLIAAYISLLLAYLIMDDPISADRVRNAMPACNYLPLMIFLKKLFNFMSITSSASGSLRGLKATSIALKFFSKADPQSNEQLKKIIPD